MIAKNVFHVEKGFPVSNSTLCNIAEIICPAIMHSYQISSIYLIKTTLQRVIRNFDSCRLNEGTQERIKFPSLTCRANELFAQQSELRKYDLECVHLEWVSE